MVFYFALHNRGPTRRRPWISNTTTPYFPSGPPQFFSTRLGKSVYFLLGETVICFSEPKKASASVRCAYNRDFRVIIWKDNQLFFLQKMMIWEFPVNVHMKVTLFCKCLQDLERFQSFWYFIYLQNNEGRHLSNQKLHCHGTWELTMCNIHQTYFIVLKLSVQLSGICRWQLSINLLMRFRECSKSLKRAKMLALDINSWWLRLSMPISSQLLTWLGAMSWLVRVFLSHTWKCAYRMDNY